MYMSNELGIGLSPLTEKIYVGRQNKVKRMWVGEKKDITDNFLDVMFAYLKDSDVRTITTTDNNGGKTKHFFIHLKDEEKSLLSMMKFIQKELKNIKP